MEGNHTHLYILQFPSSWVDSYHHTHYYYPGFTLSWIIYSS
jgi:hypothetical protein